MANNEQLDAIETEKQIQKLINEDELTSIQQEAEKITEKFETKNESELGDIMALLANLGDKEQMEASDSLEILKRPVKDLMENKNSDIPQTLLKLRECVDQLNPNDVKTKGIHAVVNRILRKNPMTKYIQKYQTVETQIDAIVQGLLRGRDRIEEDTVELELIKEKAKERITNLRKQIFLGQKVFEILEKKYQDPSYKDKEAILQDAMQKTIVRTKNMTQLVNILQQSIASVDIIKKNNEKLKEAIRNSITMTKNITTVSAAIQLALDNQSNVIKAVKSVNEATENMLLQNSKLLKQNTIETTKLLEEPSIAIDKLREAFSNVYDAIKVTEESNKNIISQSKRFVDEMNQLNEEIRKKLDN